MRDPDRYGQCRVTTFTATIQHFLTKENRFHEATRRTPSPPRAGG